MGVMRFLLPRLDRPDKRPDVDRAYISGPEGRVFPTRVDVEGDVLACRRQVSDSGKLNVAWPVPGFGRPVLSTSTLPERDEPYLLALELARGKISQVRDQVGAWEIAGMAVPEAFALLHKEAHRLFAQATASQNSPEDAGRLAGEALWNACQAADVLTRDYTRQRLARRRERSVRLPALLGCNLGQIVPDPEASGLFCDAFHAAMVPVEWRHIEPVEGHYHWDLYDEQVEWCQEQRLLTCGGPLLDFSTDGLPPWLSQWQNDLPNLQSFLCDFVETALTRYVGRIRLWEIAANVNTGGALALNEERRLVLLARTLDVARQVDEDVQLLLRIAQPWGDYQASGDHRLSPLQLVDALIRSGIKLSAVNLELGIGYHPRGTSSRDLLDVSRLIDLWSYLGLPLCVTLAFPSASSADPRTTSEIDVEENGWRDSWSEAAQAEWVDHYVPLLLAKDAVMGIFWTHFCDRTPHLFPHAGLVRHDGTPKPALDHLIRYRGEFWATAEAPP